MEPNGDNLPGFLRGFPPDLIARRPGDNVVVEVKIGTRTSVADRLRDVTERVHQRPGWRFSLVFANPDQPGEITDATPAPLAILEQRVQDAGRLLASGSGRCCISPVVELRRRPSAASWRARTPASGQFAGLCSDSGTLLGR